MHLSYKRRLFPVFADLISGMKYFHALCY